MSQDAYKNGPMFFQLTNAAGNRTHAGLLEFSAAEGFVALPRKVRLLPPPPPPSSLCIWCCDCRSRSSAASPSQDAVCLPAPAGRR